MLVFRSPDDGRMAIPLSRVARLEENVAADNVVLTADQMKRLDELTPASGGHHNEAQMEMIER